MSTEKFTVIAEKLVGHVTGIGLHWRGEPCLHPELPELSQIARGKGLKPWLSTNTAVPNLSDGDYVKKLLDNLDWIEFCVDGYNQDTVSRYRVGANWDIVKNSLENIGSLSGDCVKKMRVLMFKYNDGKEHIYRDMARKYGMDELIFATPLIGLGETISEEEAEEWLSTEKKYRRYNLRRGMWIRRTGSCNPNPIISVHGTVYPCCLDWELAHKLGDLTTESWTAIMRRYEAILPQLGAKKMCKLCCIPAQRVNFREKII